jgi:hypothetical protein
MNKKPRCYEDLQGTYKCSNIPVWLCAERECDPIKGLKVLKV